MNPKKVLEQMKARGFRLTKSRRRLVEFILGQLGHWTIQMLTDRTQKRFPDMGVATVYRTVNLLHELKFITKTQIGLGPARYEVAPAHHHDHLTCINCGEIFEFENEQIEELQRQVAKNLGFKLVDHRMELYGECHRRVCKGRFKGNRGVHGS